MSIRKPMQRPLRVDLSRAITAPSAGGGGSPGEALLAQARIYVDWSDVANFDNAVARDQNSLSVSPGRNLCAFPTGPIVNEAGGANPPRTNFSTLTTDPSGVTNNATRILSTGANQILYIARPAALGPQLPSGTYTLKFRARSAPSTGSWGITFGLSSGYLSATIQDLDWSNPANLAATTFEREFSYSGTADIAIRFTTSGTDVLIDRIQLYPVAAANVPSWDDEVFTGGRKAFCFDNAITLDSDDNADISSDIDGLMVYDPAFPAKHTYNAYTFIQVWSLLVTPGTIGNAFLAHPSESVVANQALMVEGSAPYLGELSVNPTGYRSSAGANILNKGIVIHAQTQTTTERVAYINGIPSLIESTAWTPLDISRFSVGAGGTTNKASLQALMAKGKVAANLVWDTALSIQQMRDVHATLRSRLAARGCPFFTFLDYHVFSGDSNWTRGTNDWTQVITGAGYMGSEPDVFMNVTATGGQGLGNLENGNLNDWTGTINDSGRFRQKDAPALMGAALLMDAQGSGRVGYWPGVGTNDFPRIIDNENAYIDHYLALVGEALALHPRIDVFLAGILPKFTPVGDPSAGYDSTKRATVNAAFASAAASSGGRIMYVDQGAGLVVEDMNVDGLHLITTGDAKVAANNAAAIAAWRATL